MKLQVQSIPRDSALEKPLTDGQFQTEHEQLYILLEIRKRNVKIMDQEILISKLSAVPSIPIKV